MWSVFACFARSLAAFGLCAHPSGARSLAGRVEAERLRGGGAALVSGHLGAWEAGALLLANAGVPMASVVRRMRSAAMNRLYDRLRGPVVPIPTDAPRAAVRAMREGRVVAFAMDEPVETGIDLDFFGRRCRFAAGAFRLAKAACVPVFVSAAIWNDAGRLDVPVLGPFPPDEAQRAVFALEELVRRAPTQWVLFVPRFPE